MRQTAALTDESTQPNVFVSPYSPLSHFISTRSLLLKYWPLARLAVSDTLTQPIIACQSSASILTTLVYQRAKRCEREREEKECAAKPTPPPKTTQANLPDFYRILPSNSLSTLTELTFTERGPSGKPSFTRTVTLN